MALKIAVIDLGAQYSHLIWRNIRDLDCETKLLKKDISFEDIDHYDGVVFSGGPSSVFKDTYGICEILLEKKKKGECKKPMMGICLGHQLIAHRLSGKVEKGKSAEYGITNLKLIGNGGTLLKGMPREFNAWASHFDTVKELPAGFQNLAESPECSCEAMENNELRIYSTQFHPEVWHTENGVKVLENFLKVVEISRAD